jgi:transposase-like protein
MVGNLRELSLDVGYILWETSPMPPVDRNQPIRAKSSESSFSMMEFMQVFSDDRACLDWLWRKRFSEDGAHTHCPTCDRERKFHRVNGRPVYDCDTCGHHISPTAGTIFHKSSTSLQLWFYAMWIMTSTRCGVSAKQLERELGVTYKTAWRMFNLIRNELMSQDDGPLSGEVEADETLYGGRMRNSERRKREALGWDRKRYDNEKKTMVFGPTLRATVHEFVVPGSILFTDDWKAYGHATEGSFHHRRINHSARIYVEGETHTQTVEGFFGLFKNGVRGVYHSVSRKWLQSYLDEYAWRYNRRDNARAMFLDLLDTSANPTV